MIFDLGLRFASLLDDLLSLCPSPPLVATDTLRVCRPQGGAVLEPKGGTGGETPPQPADGDVCATGV